MDVAPVQLGKKRLTEQQLRATEIALYRAADAIDRLMVDGVPYTKVQARFNVPAQATPPPSTLLQPPGWNYGGQSAPSAAQLTRGGP